MIEVMMFDYTRNKFQGYDELFEHLSEIENLKLIEETPDLKNMNWSFTVYNHDRVKALQAHMKNQPTAIKEAFEKQLSVIEICTGDFENPRYIPVTPDLDQESAKRNWCIDYCAFNHLPITENVETFREWKGK